MIMSERTGGRGGPATKTEGDDARTYGRPRPKGRRGDVAFRRTLVVTLLSVIAPGSGHLALRHRTVGRIALRTYLVLVVLAAILAIFVPRSAWLAVAFKPWLLGVIQVLAVVLGVAWAAVVFHAFWVSRPRRIQPPRRGIAVGVALGVCVLLLVPFGVVARYAGVQRDLVTSMFPSGGSGPKGRMNVLLIGGDSGADRTGTRTDTMIVASTDLATGRTTLISLPRNLQHVPMPDGPARERFPDGFDDLLNAVYGYGEQHPKLVPGSQRPGPDLLKQTIGGVLGIPIHYYVLVNLKGFQKMVDALGGVTIRVNERLPIGGDGGVPITGYVPKGLHRLNGYQALWYARSRLLSSDYDRMTRQRCLIGAIQHQADPATVLTRYQQLAAASKQMFQTDIPQNVMSKLLAVAEKAKKQKMKSLALVPPLIDTSQPDWELIKTKTRQAIDASMHTQKAGHTASSHQSSAQPTKTPTGAVSVDSVCRYD